MVLFDTFLHGFRISRILDHSTFVIFVLMLKFIRSNHPETSVGLPGSQQGLNTGVGLLHLARMRESEELNKYLRSEEMDKLAEKFMFMGALGHQVSL